MRPVAGTTPDDDPRRRLAQATRRVINELASSTADSAAFVTARDLVEQAAQVLADDDHGRSYVGVAEASLVELQQSTFVDYSPFIGALNPLAPPIAVEVRDDHVEGQVTYSGAYEGAPGCAHGGFIAAGFDEILGFAQALSGRPGMTGRLTVSYRSPTPLHQPLRYLGRVDSIDGRKIYVSATLSVVADDRLCAEAEGLFISMRPDFFESLRSARLNP